MWLSYQSLYLFVCSYKWVVGGDRIISKTIPQERAPAMSDILALGICKLVL